MPTYTFPPAVVFIQQTGALAIGSTGVLRPSAGDAAVPVYDLNGSPLSEITVGPLGVHPGFRADISDGVLDFGSVLMPAVSLEAQSAAITAVGIAETARDSAASARTAAESAAAEARTLAESILTDSDAVEATALALNRGTHTGVTYSYNAATGAIDTTVAGGTSGGPATSLENLVVGPIEPTEPTLGLVFIDTSSVYSTAPPAPTGLVSTAGDRRVTLTWAPISADYDVTAYRIFDRGTQVAQVTGTTHTLTGLTNGSAYTDVTIRAVNRNGVASDPAIFRSFVPAAPGSLFYVSSFNTDPVGELPIGWSSIWSPTRSVVVAEVSPGRKALHFSAAATNARTGIVYDAVPSATTDMEVLARARFTGVEGVGGPLVRASGASGTETGLTGREIDGDRHILAYTTGAATVLATPATAATAPRDVWMWQRVRVSGTTISYRIWADGTAEPSTWTLTASTAGHATSGKAGYFAFYDSGVFDVDYMSGALNGATAPLPVA